MSYASLLETHPLRVKIVTGVVIAGLGDVICQLALENERCFNVKRAAIFAFVGGVVISPVLHVWYHLLSTRLPSYREALGNGPIGLCAHVLAYLSVFRDDT